MAKERRALADESVRDSVPSNSPDVGQRYSQDLVSNLKADPSWAAAILNPDVFDSLASISKDIHDTRRTSRYYDDQRDATWTLNQQDRIDYMNLQTMKNEADVTLGRLQNETMKKWYNWKEQIRRGEITNQQMLGNLQEEIFTLQGNNEAAGNYYIAEQIYKWGMNLFNSEYPSAVAEDYDRSELKVEGAKKADANVRTISVSSGKMTSSKAIEDYGLNAIRVSSATKSPEDGLKFTNTAQDFYLAEAGRLYNYFSQNPEVDMETQQAAFEQLIASGFRTPEPEDDLSNYPAILGIDGQPVREGKFGTWVVGTRDMSDAERALFENAGKPGWPTKDELLANTNFEKDENGNLTGKIKEVWDGSMSAETRDKIVELMAKLNNSNSLHYSLSQADYYERMIGWDDLKQGHILNNSYLQQATISSGMEDFRKYTRYMDSIIANGSPSQVSEAIKRINDVRNRLFGAQLIYEFVRSRQGLGMSQEETANLIMEYKAKLDGALNDNDGTRSLQAGAVDLTFTNGNVTMDMMMKDQYLDGSADKGFQRYAYGKDLSELLGSVHDELLQNPGAMVQINDQVSKQFRALQTKIDPNNFMYVNKDGSYSTNQAKLNDAKQQYNETMTHAKYAGDATGVVYTVGETLKEATSAVSKLPGAAREEALSDYSKIMGSDILSAGNFANQSTNVQQIADAIGMYQLLGHASIYSNYEQKVKDNRANNIVSPTKERIQDLIKSRQFKLKNGSIDDIDKLIMQMNIKPQYLGAARSLAYNLIAASAAAGDSEFDMKVLKQILNENFQGGEYKYASVYDTSKIYTPASSSGPTENTLSGYLGYKDTMTKALQNSSISTKSLPFRNDSTGDFTVTRPDKTQLITYGKNGDKIPFSISKTIAPGVTGNNALKAKTDMLILANNAYDLSAFESNALSSAKIYNGSFETDYNMKKDVAQREAMQVLNTLNDPSFQKLAQEFIQNPSQFHIDTKSQPTPFELYISAGLSADRVRRGSYSWDDNEKATITDKGVLEKVNLYRLAKAYHANPQKVSTLTFSNEYYAGPRQIVKEGQAVTPFSGAKGFTLSSDFGYRIHPKTGVRTFHHGQDFAAPAGTLWKSDFSGTITEVGNDPNGYGLYVRMKTDSGYSMLFGHFEKIASGIQKGTYVKASTPIGYVGSTGNSTGPHTHAEVSNAYGKEFAYLDLVNGTSAHTEEDPATKKSNMINDTRNMLKRQGYTISDQELKYLQSTYEGKTFDENDAQICGRSFGQAQASTNNLDPKSDYHKLRVYGHELSLLKYKVFDRNQPEYAIGAMMPGVTFKYVQAGTNKVINNLSGLSGKQILNKYKAGQLKNLPNTGTWVPEDISKFDAALAAYRRAK